MLGNEFVKQNNPFAQFIMKELEFYQKSTNLKALNTQLFGIKNTSQELHK